MVLLSYVVFGFTPLIICGWIGIYILVKGNSSLATTQAFNTSSATSVHWLADSGLLNATGSGTTFLLHRSLLAHFMFQTGIVFDWCVVV